MIHHDFPTMNLRLSMIVPMFSMTFRAMPRHLIAPMTSRRRWPSWDPSCQVRRRGMKRLAEGGCFEGMWWGGGSNIYKLCNTVYIVCIYNI